VQTAEAKAHDAAMRTITIMLPLRYNESPAPPVRDQMIPPSADGGPSHGPLSGELLGALPQEPPFVVSRWSARFDAPPPESSGVDSGSPASEADHDRSAKESLSSPVTPGFIFNLLTGSRYQPPPQETPPAELPAWNRFPANDIRRQQMAPHARPEVEWQPAQLVHRYVKLHRDQQQPHVVHRDRPRSDTMLNNNVMMTAVAYGPLGNDQSQQLSDRTTSSSTTSTTTAATTNKHRQRKLSAEYRRRASGRYRSYQYPAGRRALRRYSNIDLSFDSSDEDDDDDEEEVLEALFRYDRSPMNFRRVRRPSSSIGSRRVYGRKRLGDGGGDRRRRWRQRSDGPGKLRRRTGSRATISGDREKKMARSRRPSDTETASDKPTQQRTKSDVSPDTDSSHRVSLLHIVVSRQQDFAAPQPGIGFMEHPGLFMEPRPLDVDALHSLPHHHPFIQPSPPFLPLRPFIPDIRMQQQQDRYVASVRCFETIENKISVKTYCRI